MSDRHSNTTRKRTLHEALHRREREDSVPPAFDVLWRRIASSPSPLDRPRWTASRTLRLAGALTVAQLRVVPWVVTPVILVTATLAVLTARFLGVSQDAFAAASSFSALMLFGVTVTVTMALSRVSPDAVSLATPLGPQVVVFARVGVVLLIDAAIGIASSVLIASSGTAGSFGDVVAGWLVPLAVVAGVVTFISIWVAPWAAMVAGVVLVPFVGPRPGAAMDVGLGAVFGTLRVAITPFGLVALGIVVLVIAVLSARQALAASALRAAGSLS